LGVDDPAAESQGDDLDQGTEKFGGAGAVESEFLVDGVSQCGLDPTAEDVEVVGVAEVWGSVERHADDSCEGLVGCLTFLVYQSIGQATLGEKNKRKLLKESS
jgi:hypothetical protein